jgi:hypothetical protein
MKVLLDNDCVRVQYHDVAVAQKVPMHTHPNYVVYTLNPFKARITLPDGRHPQPDRRAEAGRQVPVTPSANETQRTRVPPSKR